MANDTDTTTTLATDQNTIQRSTIAPGVGDCWNSIGVRGDSTCSELPKYVHCRNCPVFTAAGKTLFDREPPGHFVDEWTRALAEDHSRDAGEIEPVVIFRVGEEWLAIDARTAVEVNEWRVVHRIPHRSDRLLLGLVNVRGELHLGISLRELLGIDAAQPDAVRLAAKESGSAYAAVEQRRLLVVERGACRWVFQVDEVVGVRHVPVVELVNVPTTVAKGTTQASRAVFPFEHRRVGLLNEDRIFDMLQRRIG